MKNFILSIFFILFGISTLIIALEILFKDTFNFVEEKFKQLENADDVSVLILGNSHAQALFAPDFNNKKSYNFGVGGQDIFHMLIIAEHAINKAPRNSLKYIIVGLDYDLIGYNFKIANMAWLDRLYYPTTGRMYDLSTGSVILAKSNFFRANRNFSSAMKTFGKKDKGDELKKVDKSFTNNSSCDKRAKEHSINKFDESLVEENFTYLEELVELSEQHGVTLIFVNFPKKNCYYDNYDKEVVDLAQQKIRAFGTQRQVKFIDFWRSPEFDDSMFTDNDHLNKVGGQKLTAILQQQLP